MTQAKKGDTVKIHYTGKLDDGTVFDTSSDRDPLQFLVGSGQVIPGFDEAVIGMAPGDTKTANIPADKAYGPRQEEMVMEVNIDQFPPSITPEVGQQLELKTPEGHPVIVRVTSVSDTTVVLDANPPLAGKDLTFEIELVAID